jgi:hypothetical protein
MLNPDAWQDYLLMISWSMSGRDYSLLLDHVSQEECFAYIMKAYGGFPNHVSVLRLNEASFDIWESTFRKNGAILEG